MTFILIILVLILYAKWIAVAITFPWLCMLFHFRKHNGKKGKIPALPGMALEKFTTEGVSRFVIINIGTIPSVTTRRLLYKWLGANLEPDVIIHYKTEIRAPYRLSIGQGSIIGDNAILDARNGLRIGKHVNLSSNVSIYTEQHDYKDPLFSCSSEKKPCDVEINDRAWIGSNVIILPGVKIGKGAVCCSGCVVTKDVEPYYVVAGIPAKKIAERPQQLEYIFDGTSCWFY